MAKKQRMVPAATAARMVRSAVAAVKKAEEAKSRAHLKAFAARMIVDLAKAAGISPPPKSVRRAAMARGRKRANAARSRARKTVARAKARSQQMRASA
jgi:hypothetical protein